MTRTFPAAAGLRAAVARTAQEALARGALEPVSTELHVVEAEGAAFVVRVAPGLRRKSREVGPRAGDPPDPFLPFDPALFVADLSDTHLCLLNRFPVIAGHVLVVTRHFEEQTSPLGLADFEALLACLGAIDGLGFVNVGELAGASQRHKHLQVVPTPLGPGPRRLPIDPLLEEAEPLRGIGFAPRLGFRHGIARSPELGVPGAAAACLARYRELLAELRCEAGRDPHNLLLTRERMLLVPRSCERFDGISVNALGYAGSLLVVDAAQLRRVLSTGPLAVLRAVATR